MAFRNRRLAACVFLLSLGGIGCLAAAPPSAEIRVAGGTDPGTLDFHRWPQGFSSPLFTALADTLVVADPKTGIFKPGLAESWTTKEGRTWTFVLKSARWSDGTPVTAQDVMDSWRQTPDVESMAAPDPKHLRVTFRSTLPSVAALGTYRYAVLDSGTDRSSGPFRVESWIPHRSLVLVRNPSFREASSILFQRVTFVFTDTLQEAERLYQKGLLDWVPWGGGPGTDVAPGKKDEVVSPGWATVFLRLNLKNAPLDNRDFRQSLSRSLDRNFLLKGLRGPRLVPSSTLIPRLAASVPPPKAKPLPGALSFTVLHLAGETPRRLASGLASQWGEQLGLSVDTKESLQPNYLADRNEGLYSVALSGWLGDFADPLTFLQMFGSDSPLNDMGYADPGFDALLANLAATTPGKDRDKLVDQAEKKLLADLPVVPLASFAAVNQIDLRRWSGWYPTPTDVHPWVGFGPRK